MAFDGDLVKHEQIVLVHCKTQQIIDARSVSDKTMRLGESAYLEVAVVRGLPVTQATVNVNEWDVYKIGDERLAEFLLDRAFKMEPGNVN
jgi:hypothetical protein